MGILDAFRGKKTDKEKEDRGFYSTVAAKAEATETLKVTPSRYAANIGDKVYSWATKCREFDRYYNDCMEVKSQVLTLAGRSTGMGLFLSPRKTNDVSREAVRLCEELNRDLGLDQMLYETVVPTVKYGTALWEVDRGPPFDVQLIPVVAEYKPIGFSNFEVDRWEITDNGFSKTPPQILDEGSFAEFSWNKTDTSWPYGTSLLMGLGSTIETLNKLISALSGYMENNAWPCGLFGLGEEGDRPSNEQLQELVSKIRNRAPSEQFATQWKVDYKVIGPAAGETRILGEALKFLKDRLIDGTLVPPVSKQQQRTLASAELMDYNTVQAIVVPMQRLLKRVLERQVYWPYLETQGMGISNVPRVSFESPSKDRNANADYYIKLYQAGLISQKAAARELGIIEEDVPTQAQAQPPNPEQALAQKLGLPNRPFNNPPRKNTVAA